IYNFNFTDCQLDYAQFYALKLKKMQFINCSMVAVDFMGSDLTEALFDNCNLRRAVFIDTILQKADFYTSYDFIIDPEKNKVKKAIFSTEGLRGLLSKYDLVIKN
ncbi:MAG: pentapeptide repeat-containing protein, partial [Candidatus Paceibacterota bacterium]